ncbi:purine-cytosine permease family protein [Bacillus salitolerans]|uniref:Purine-cytosine permease family protein n=1 Tax=Bacillus salitolerans TaxID=1437434 RepID=A0ABW4LVX5_9BACI
MSKHNRIEKFGLDPVPNELKNTRWFDYLYIQLAFSVNAGNFLVPALAVIEGGLSFIYAVLSTVIGAAIAFSFVSWLSLPGASYGIPSQYAIRSILGIKGAKYIGSPIRTLTSLYWFAVQTIGGTFVIKELINRLFQIHVPFTIIALLLSSLMAILALIGFNMIKSVTKYFIPILILGQGVIIYIFIINSPAIINVIAPHTNFSFHSFFFYTGLAFVQYVSGVSSSADIARYSKSEKHSVFGLFFGNVIGFVMTAILGAFSAAQFQHLNPFVSATQLTSSFSLVTLISLCAIVSMISINMSNAYTGGFSLLNSFPKLGRLKSAMIFGILGVILSCFPTLVTQAKDYISLLGAFIIPLSAVIVTDFIFIKRNKIDINDLERIFDKQYQLNHVAFLTISFGIIIYFMLYAYTSPGIYTFMGSSSIYIVIKKLATRKQIKKKSSISV